MRNVVQTVISPERRLVMAAISCGLFAAFAMLFAVAPAGMPFPECIFRSVTGHSCLTCGLTRSLHAIAHGHFIESVRYHLFGPTVFGAGLLCCTLFGAEAISGRRIVPSMGGGTATRLTIAFGVCWFLYWTVRLIREFA